MPDLEILTVPRLAPWDVPDFTAAPGADRGTGVEAAMIGGGSTAGEVAITIDHPPDRVAQLPNFIGEPIFEHIHIILADHAFGRWGFLDLGPVLSEVAVPTEVWNAYRWVSQTLDTIGVTTSGGFTVEGEGTGLAIAFNPLQSRIFLIEVDLDGPPTLDDLALFDFGLGTAPANVQGVRLIPFPFRINWPMQETFKYATNIIESANGSEQRIRQRRLPRRGIAGTVVVGESDAATYLQALLFGWNTHAYGVPMWWNVAELSTAVSIGEVVLPITDTTDRDLIAGRICLLWRAHNDWESVVLESVDGPNQVTIRSPLRKNWTPRRTLLLPVRLGRLADTVPHRRDGRHLASMDVAFEIEASE
jgi:hypothetical protein